MSGIVNSNVEVTLIYVKEFQKIQIKASKTFQYDGQPRSYTFQPADFAVYTVDEQGNLTPRDDLHVSELIDSNPDNSIWTLGPIVGSSTSDFEHYGNIGSMFGVYSPETPSLSAIAKIADNDGNDVTDQYGIQASFNISVEPVDVFLTVENVEKEAGEDDPEFTFTAAGFVGGEDISDIQNILDLIEIRRTEEGEDAGTYKIEFVYKSNGEPVERVKWGYPLDFVNEVGADYNRPTNYYVHVVPGTLTIKGPETYSVTVNYEDVEGNAIQDPSTQTYATGSTYDVITPEIDGYTFYYAEGELSGIVSGNVEVTLVYVKEYQMIQIVARKTFQYDGQPRSYTFQPADFAVYTVDEQGNLTPRGDLHVAELYEPNPESPLWTLGPITGCTTSDFVTNGVAGSSHGVYLPETPSLPANAKIVDDQGNDVTNQYNIQASMSIQVDPVDLYLTVENAEKDTGTDDPEFTFTAGDFVEGEDISDIQNVLDLIEIHRTEEGEDAGDYKIEFVYKSTGTPVDHVQYGFHLQFVNEVGRDYNIPTNYKVYVVPGTLTINPPKSYTVTTNYVDTEGNIVQDATSQTVIEGAEYTVVVPEIEGYTFEHVDEDAELTGTITEDTVVTLVYSQNSYTLTVYYVDTEGTELQQSLKKEDYHYGDSYAVDKPEIANYVFSTARRGAPTAPAEPAAIYTVKAIANEEDILSGTITDNVEITLVYNRTYTVTYTDGVEDAEAFADQVTHDLVSGAPTPAYDGGTPTREGYEFNGWAPAVSPTVTGDVTYVAQWTPVTQPSTSPEPTTSTEPTTSPEPTTSTEPTTSPEPTTSTEPTTSPEPTTSTEPTTSPEPTTSTEPTTSPEPTASTEPTTSPEPTASTEPTTSPEPTASTEPTTSPEPTTSTEPTTSPEPTASTEPTTSPEPTASTEPTTSPEPTPTQAPSPEPTYNPPVVDENDEPPADNPNEPPVDIPDENPPLSEEPEEPPVDIPDENPPLSEEPEDIPDENPPLSEEPEDIPDENPPLSEEPEDIPDENPPLSEEPEDLPDENPPLSETPEVTSKPVEPSEPEPEPSPAAPGDVPGAILPDEQVPGSEAPPSTGETIGATSWTVLLLASAAALAVMFVRRKRTNG